MIKQTIEEQLFTMVHIPNHPTAAWVTMHISLSMSYIKSPMFIQKMTVSMNCGIF